MSEKRVTLIPVNNTLVWLEQSNTFGYNSLSLFGPKKLVTLNASIICWKTLQISLDLRSLGPK
jgi:hypothetical protein